MVILPDAPPIINIGTYVSLCGGTARRECTLLPDSGSTREHVPVIAVTIGEHVPIPEVTMRERDHITRLCRRSRYVARLVAAVMIQFTVGRALICYHFFV